MPGAHAGPGVRPAEQGWLGGLEPDTWGGLGKVQEITEADLCVTRWGKQVWGARACVLSPLEDAWG